MCSLRCPRHLPRLLRCCLRSWRSCPLLLLGARAHRLGHPYNGLRSVPCPAPPALCRLRRSCSCSRAGSAHLARCRRATSRSPWSPPSLACAIRLRLCARFDACLALHRSARVGCTRRSCASLVAWPRARFRVCLTSPSSVPSRASLAPLLGCCSRPSSSSLSSSLYLRARLSPSRSRPCLLYTSPSPRD